MSYEKEKEEEGGSFSLGALSVSPARERNFNYRTQRANARTPPFFLLFPPPPPRPNLFSRKKGGKGRRRSGSSTKGRRRGRQRGFCSLLPPSCLIMRSRPRSPAIESRNKITPRLRWHGRARAPFTTFALLCVPFFSPNLFSRNKKETGKKGRKRYKGRGSYNYCRVPSEPTGLD